MSLPLLQDQIGKPESPESEVGIPEEAKLGLGGCLRSRRGFCLRSRGGFTVIELVVVMGIILILVSLLIVGMRHWGATANRQVTVQRLEVLNGMLNDLQAIGGKQFANQWFMSAPTTPASVTTLPLDVSVYGNVNSEVQSGTTTPSNDILTLNGMPNQVIGHNNRQQAIDDTSQGIMFRFASLPATAKAMQTLPPSALAQFITATPQPPITYATGMTAPGTPLTVPALTNWPPVVLDGWGNPIIFVPNAGMINSYVNVIYASSANGYTGTKIDGTIVPPITSPDSRPFWVSAGPDGDFVKGDDNIYSFSPQ